MWMVERVVEILLYPMGDKMSLLLPVERLVVIMLVIMLEEVKVDRLRLVPLPQMQNLVVMGEMREEIVREIGDYFKQMQKVTIVEEEVVQQLREILLMKI